MVSVRLSRREFHEATTLGMDTTKICRMQNTNPRGEEGRGESDILGALAEFAVAKLYGADKPRLNVVNDGGLDLWVGNTSIDVKYTRTGLLIFDSLEHFKADIAVLVCATDEDDLFNVVGGVSQSAFAQRCFKKDLKYGSKLVMEGKALSPPEKVWLFLNESRGGQG